MGGLGQFEWSRFGISLPAPQLRVARLPEWSWVISKTFSSSSWSCLALLPDCVAAGPPRQAVTLVVSSRTRWGGSVYPFILRGGLSESLVWELCRGQGTWSQPGEEKEYNMMSYLKTRWRDRTSDQEVAKGGLNPGQSHGCVCGDCLGLALCRERACLKQAGGTVP
jgi:hypothetical protein